MFLFGSLDFIRIKYDYRQEKESILNERERIDITFVQCSDHNIHKRSLWKKRKIRDEREIQRERGSYVSKSK